MSTKIQSQGHKHRRSVSRKLEAKDTQTDSETIHYRMVLGNMDVEQLVRKSEQSADGETVIQRLEMLPDDSVSSPKYTAGCQFSFPQSQFKQPSSQYYCWQQNYNLEILPKLKGYLNQQTRNLRHKYKNKLLEINTEYQIGSSKVWDEVGEKQNFSAKNMMNLRGRNVYAE